MMARLKYRRREAVEFGRVKTECDGTSAETRFGLPAKRTSPFTSAGGVSSVQYWLSWCAGRRRTVVVEWKRNVMAHGNAR